MLVAKNKSTPGYKAPEAWAKAASVERGFPHALKVSYSCARPMIGKDNSEPNPYYHYWCNAFQWLFKRATVQARTDFLREVEAQKAAEQAQQLAEASRATSN